MLQSMTIRCRLWVLVILVPLIWTSPHKNLVRELYGHTRPVVADNLLLHVDEIQYEKPRFIRGTLLNTTYSVKQFQSRLSCFSKSGKWTLDPNPTAAYCKVDTTPHRYCNSSHANLVLGSTWLAEPQGPDFRARKSVSWVWQTNASCPSVPYHRVDICKRVSSIGNMLITGDSISYQIFTTFLNFMRSNHSHVIHSDHGFGYEHICGDVVTGGGINLAWVWDPFLNPNIFLPYVEEWDIKTVLVNTGAKYRDDLLYVKAVQSTIDVLQARYPHLLVIFRNTPPGHKDCGHFQKPLKKPQDKGDLPYNWGNFARQNELARAIVDKARYIYLDVDTMLSLRPDEHMKPPVDCLHYAIPGPLDIVFHLFYNMLFLLPYKLHRICVHASPVHVELRPGHKQSQVVTCAYSSQCNSYLGHSCMGGQASQLSAGFIVSQQSAQ